MGFASRLVNRCVSIAALLAFLAAPGLARAATITVGNTTDPANTSGNGFCTLREAINNSNAASDTSGGDCIAGTGNDTINFSVSGTVTLGSTLPAIANVLTIDGSGQTVGVDGANSYQASVVNSGATLNMTALTIANAKLPTDNNATGNPLDTGAGILNFGTLTVTNCTFSSNTAFSGGAISNFGIATVNGSNFYNNRAAGFYGYGGAIYSWYGGASLTISGSTFSYSFANDEGDAVYSIPTTSVLNSTFFHNFTGGYGGAINQGDGSLSVENSTFSMNHARTDLTQVGNMGGGGIASRVQITVSNSILAGNAGGNCANNQAVTNGGGNISDDLSCGFGNPTGANGQTLGDNVDPLLDPNGLQNNGGPTQTIALQSTSPAIDAIPQGNANCPGLDQRGFGRPAPGYADCDVGAFEFAAVPPGAPPTITISAPTNTTYTLNQPVPSIYTCTDPVASDAVTVCAGPVADGADFDTASVGSKTFTVNATDSHNLSSSQSVNYTVAYNICPQYDKSHSVKSGATIPIKLDLCDLNGVDQSGSGIVVHATGVVMVSNNASEILQDAGDSNPDDDFRFDSTLGTTGGYIFNLSTKGYPSGTFNLQFTAGNDPTTHVTSFQVH